MASPTRAPGYDLFKLIVAIVLLILALILMWAAPPQPSVSLLITSTAGPVSSTPPPLTATGSPSPLPTGTGAPEPTATPLPISTSPPLTATPSPMPPPAKTQASGPTATPLPSATPGTGTSVADICETAASGSRLQVGTNATILRRLNFRSSPGIHENWLQTNLPGTPVKIVAGPQCVPYWTGAYLWWQIQLPDGRLGWSAEESLHGSFYFMEPQ